jgi:SAM-dependent methyltransferase
MCDLFPFASDHGPFDAAVSSSCLHNLRDFKRIGEIYRDVRTHLKPSGVFLNVDLVNAPTETGPFPADLDGHLAALRAAGFATSTASGKT